MTPSGTQILMAVATIVAMLVATKVTLTYAKRPDGMINQYGQPQSVGPGGQVEVYGVTRPVAPPAPEKEEKPLWIVWLQMWGVSQFAATLVVFILTGGFGAYAAVFGQGG